jgi:RNA polymerase sigma-70 factor (ECF subfamily)
MNLHSAMPAMNGELVQITDEALVLAARAGDQGAFARLVARHFRTVWTIAYARLGQRAGADDLAQEAFLLAFLRLQTLSDPRRFGAWVCRIARNRITDWLRQNRKSSEWVAMVPLEHLDQATSAEEPAMDREEEQGLVRQAVMDLPKEQREAVLLKFTEGLNNTEIGERLEVHPVTVGRHLEKAMLAMRSTLASLMDESIRELKPSRQAMSRATSLESAVAVMPAASRAVLVEKVAHVHFAGEQTLLLKGAVFIMTAGKIKVAIVVGIILLMGLGITVVAIKSSNSAAAPSETPVSVLDQRQWQVKFSDGTVVELLGMQSAPFYGKWWGADGLEVPEPTHPDQPRIVMSGDIGTHTVRLMIRPTSNWRGNQDIKVQVVPSVRAGVSGFQSRDGQIFEAVAIVDDEVKVADVQIGVASGLWTDDVTYDVASGQYSPQGAGGIRVVNISEQDGETRVEVQYPPNMNMNVWKDTSVVAMAGGQQLQIRHSEEHGSGLVCYFRCNKKDLAAVISRSRDYEIKTLYDVHLSMSAPLPPSPAGGK